MKIFAYLIAFILMIFAALNSASAQESKGKVSKEKVPAKKAKQYNSEKTSSANDVLKLMNFRSTDAKNVYFLLRPLRFNFTIEF